MNLEILNFTSVIKLQIIQKDYLRMLKISTTNSFKIKMMIIRHKFLKMSRKILVFKTIKNFQNNKTFKINPKKI
jgi:hypothetical protein